MASFFRLVLALVLGIIVAVQAQETTVSATKPSYPACATKCIASAFGGGYCAPTNQTCICTNEQFQLNVTLCVSASCTIPEALATKNASLTNCGAPVRNRSGEYVVLSNVMAILAAVCVLTRFGYKIFLAGLDIGWDDWFVMATLIAAMPSAVITVHGTTANGLGRDIWTLTPQQITNVLFYFYIMAWLYFFQVTLVKLAIIFFYMRIFPAREVQRVLWATTIFIIVWGLAFVVTAVFQCKPIHYFWVKWDRMHEGSCADANAISWSNAAISIALDLWMLAIPLWQLRTLRLHWKKKVGVALMFIVGTFVTVVSIIRLQSLVDFAKGSNATMDFIDVSVWSTIEICVGIMCACLPSIRMILVKIFPAMSGSTLRSKGRQYYQQYGSDIRSKNAAQRSQARTVGVVTVDRSNSVHDAHDRQIKFQKTFTVSYSDSEEADLVPMNNLQKPGRVHQ
ncbi:CFEM domain-containing protein [Colletotrichum phormii]|uniref:CFEM domain-containing protein n=1 Tax=Colletotrichum phormii TaxID=359342 RepID=A0AAI9ZH60_9PEZI|nr:CFEM domain-containing protein [Colletotrichum phormii]KAK1623500.1 CFEM domain-containing protein [Colletotrichum phormii]